MHDRIMQKAFEKMNAHGVKFTMAELARDLGMSKSTIYQHFESKESLIGALVDLVIADMCGQNAAIIADPALSSLEKFKAFLKVYPTCFGPVNDRLIDDVQRYLPQEWAKFMQHMEQEWESIEKILRDDMLAGKLPPVNLALLQRIYTVVMNGIIDYQFLVNSNLTSYEATDALADFLTYGLAGKRP